jgi:antitoxin ParD1/3/4/toxin ParE1/3/4
MTPRYVLAPQAAQDLAEIWRHIGNQSSLQMANHVESVIRQQIEFLSHNPGVGHRRRDLTSADVRFFPVYSYLVVYRSGTKPLQIVTILHGRRDLETILTNRL